MIKIVGGALSLGSILCRQRPLWSCMHPKSMGIVFKRGDVDKNKFPKIILWRPKQAWRASMMTMSGRLARAGDWHKNAAINQKMVWT
jgi:hypothetical protein